MLQEALQNDTVLKQLHQGVGTELSNSINLSRELIRPQNIRKIDSITKKDSIFRAVQSKVAHFPQNISVTNEKSDLNAVDSILPIGATNVQLHTSIAERPGLVLPERPLPQGKPDWFVGIFILVFVLLATVRLFFNKYLEQLFHAIVNYSTSSRLFRERTVSLTHASFRLDVIFYFVFSIFVYQLFSLFQISFGQASFVTYLIILGMVIGYFVLKRVAYFFTAIVSENVSETAEFFYNVNIHNRILGLFLIPVTLIIAFASLANPYLVAIAGLLICGVFYFLLLIRGAKILMAKQFSIFYLILYLCTLEILPLIFIYKLVLVNNGIK